MVWNPASILEAKAVVREFLVNSPTLALASNYSTSLSTNLKAKSSTASS